MNLTGTTHSLEVTTSSTSQIDYLVDYTVIDKSGASVVTTPASADGAISSVTTTTVLSAPGASIYRTVKKVSLHNTGASANSLTVQKDVGGTNRELVDVTLQAGETLEWTEPMGWAKYNANGIRVGSPQVSSAASSVMAPPFFASANLTSVRTITSTNTMAVYVGKAPRALSSVQVRLRVTTAAATITWAEVAIAKGSISIGANPSLTVVGTADVSAVVNSTGQKSVTVNVSAGQAINEGDDLWVLIGNQATTALIVRALSIADDLQVGVQAALATRPSLNVGSAQAYTIDGATVLAPWVALVL